MNHNSIITLNKKITWNWFREYYIVVSFIVYTVFPVFSFFNNFLPAFIQMQHFEWRDYIWYVTAFSIVVFSIDCYKKRRLYSKNDFRKYSFFIPFAMLSLWMIISTCITGFRYESVIGNYRSRSGLICSLCYLMMFVLAVKMHSEKHRKIWITVLIAVSGFISLAVLIGYYFLPDTWNFAYQDLIFLNRNHICYYLLVASTAAGISALLETGKKKCIFFFIAFILSEWALLVSDTLGCTLAFVFMIPFVLIALLVTHKFAIKRFLVFLLLSVCIFAIAYVIPNSSGNDVTQAVSNNIETLKESAEAVTDIKGASDNLGSGRMVLWRRAIQCISEKPIFGYGLKAMREQLSDASSGWNDTVHNEFLEYASNYGIPALIFYLLGIFGIYFRGLRNRKKLSDINVVGICVSFAYLVSSFFGVTMFYTAPYLFIFLGFAYYSENKREKL